MGRPVAKHNAAEWSDSHAEPEQFPDTAEITRLLIGEAKNSVVLIVKFNTHPESDFTVFGMRFYPPRCS